MADTVRPRAYSPGVRPTVGGEGATVRFLMEELRRVSETLSDLVDLTPQEADSAPKRLRSGMIRMARAPWRPVAGQTQDNWVYFDGVTSTWKYL